MSLVIGAAALLAAASGESQSALAKANAEKAPGVRVEVTELRRTSGNTMTLRAVIINDSDKTFTPGPPDRIYLFNAATRLKHTVAKDETGTCLCSRVRAIKGKSRAELWAKFMAPAEGVLKLSVVIPKFSPVGEVPVTP